MFHPDVTRSKHANWWSSSSMCSSTFGRGRAQASTVAGSTAVSRRPWKIRIGIVRSALHRVVAARVRVQLVVDGHHAGRSRSGRRSGRPARLPVGDGPTPPGPSSPRRRSRAPAPSAPAGATRPATARPRCTATKPPRLEPISVDRRGRAVQSARSRLLEHPRHRQRREVRLVQVRRLERRSPARAQPLPRYVALPECADEAKPWR